MEILSLLIIAIPIIAFLYFSLWIGDRTYDGAIKRANQRRQQQMLDEFYLPRYSEEHRGRIHSDSVIVMALAQPFGDAWHVVLAGWEASEHLDTISEGTYFLACTGQQTEPIDVHPKAPTHDALHHAITCPACRATMSRVYALNNQPQHVDYLHPQQMQLLLTPDMVQWDIRCLHPKAQSLNEKPKW